MELGPLQKKWIKSLREHPERQGKHKLGAYKSENEYTACCLGELHICYHRMNNLPLPLGYYKPHEIQIISDGTSEGILVNSYRKYGLKSEVGYIDGKGIPSKSKDFYKTLSSANDSGISWLEIADFIEKHPKLVFDKSV